MQGYLTFESVDEILKCGYSYKLSCGGIDYAVQGFESVDGIIEKEVTEQYFPYPYLGTV